MAIIERDGSAAGTSIGGVALPSSLAEMEERVIACHELWRRSPGQASWPFAGDAPWHLMTAEAGDFGGEGVDGAASERRPRVPLDSAEVDERDRVTGWLQHAGEPVDRRIVWLATRQLHHGEGRVPWTAIREWLAEARSPAAIRKRYVFALARMLAAVRGKGSAWARARGAEALRDGMNLPEIVG